MNNKMLTIYLEENCWYFVTRQVITVVFLVVVVFVCFKLTVKNWFQLLSSLLTRSGCLVTYVVFQSAHSKTLNVMR